MLSLWKYLTTSGTVQGKMSFMLVYATKVWIPVAAKHLFQTGLQNLFKSRLYSDFSKCEFACGSRTLTVVRDPVYSGK